MKQYFLAMTLFLSLLKGSHAGDQEKIVIGHKVIMHSVLLDKEMQLSIHIPDDYNGSEERYPVLYIFQTHFAQVSGAVKHLYHVGLTPKMIVVSIDNYEFGYLTPTKVENDPNSGKADVFLQFFQEELFPFIDSIYRTHQYRVLFSNSRGAMFAVYAILKKPDVFDAAIASIPWIRYDEENRFLINNAGEFLSHNKYRNFLYMSMDNESEILPDLEVFLKVLKKIPTPGFEWQYHYWPEEDHTSTPYRSIHSGLRSLFAGWNTLPPDIVNKGLAAIKQYEVSLYQRFGYPIGISPSALRLAGQQHLGNKTHDEAILIFRYAIEKQPDNVFAYVTLGRAYEERNMLQSARETYRQAYDLAVMSVHPQVKWVKSFLDRINQKIDHGTGTGF